MLKRLGGVLHVGTACGSAVRAGARLSCWFAVSQGNFEDLVGYEEDCSPESLPEVGGAEAAAFLF